jgi:hypothetical protein
VRDERLGAPALAEPAAEHASEESGPAGDDDPLVAEIKTHIGAGMVAKTGPMVS